MPCLAARLSPPLRVAAPTRRPHSRRALSVAAMAAKKPVGMVGLGIMGEAMARNLLKLGQGVVVWNRSADKCAKLVSEGAVAARTPADVVAQCDLTFAMLSDPAAAEAVALGPGGVLEGVTAGKGYVDMSTGT